MLLAWLAVLKSAFVVKVTREREVGLVKSLLYTENWLSPAIQATWEARTEGWLEVQRPLPN